jgi:hypothetical protein
VDSELQRNDDQQSRTSHPLGSRRERFSNILVARDAVPERQGASCATNQKAKTKHSVSESFFVPSCAADKSFVTTSVGG